MSDIFGLDPASTREADALAQSRIAPVPTKEEMEGRLFFEGASARGLMRPSASAGRSIGILLSPLAMAVDKVANPFAPFGAGDITEKYFETVDRLGNDAVDYWTPDPSTMGTGAKILNVGSNVAGSLPMMIGAPAGFVAESGIGPSTDLIRQGVDADTAFAVGGTNALANAIGMKLPASFGSTLTTRVATGAGANVGLGVGADAISSKALNAEGYTEQAQAYNVFDPYNRGADALFGAAFGVRANTPPAPRVVQDAVLTKRLDEQRRVASMPGVPQTPKAAMDHVRASDEALAQVLDGKPVDVAARIDPAQFRPVQAPAADPLGNYPAFRRALESGGRADARNPNSTATGADQFIAPTWLAIVAKEKPAWADDLTPEQILAQRTDPQKSAEMAAALDRDNAAALRSAGQPVTRHTLYAAHHFGPDKAVAFARAADDTPMSQILTPAQLKANPYLRGKTKAEAIANWDARAAKAGVDVAAIPDQPARVPFADPDAMAAARADDLAARYDMPIEEARAIIPPALRDRVTGFFDARVGGDMDAYMARAADHTARTGEPAHWVAADVANLGGLNDFAGNRSDVANVHYRAMAEIMADELRASGADVVPMRTGGDELGAIVINADGAKVDAAIERAQVRLAEYARREGLAEIPHPKRSGEKGVGLHIGRASIQPGEAPATVRAKAEAGVDLSKRRMGNVARGEAGTAGAAAPAARRAGAGPRADRVEGGERRMGGDAGRAGGGGDAARGGGQGDAAEPAAGGLRDAQAVASETPDAQIVTGFDADGQPVYSNIRDALAQIEAERAVAVRDADAFNIAAACVLRRGEQ